MRIESEKPTQLPIDSTFHFGASSRMYILRERPQTAPRPILEELEEEAKSEHQDGGLLGLPETEMELDVRNILCSSLLLYPCSKYFIILAELDRVQHSSQSADLYAWYSR